MRWGTCLLLYPKPALRVVRSLGYSSSSPSSFILWKKIVWETQPYKLRFSKCLCAQCCNQKLSLIDFQLSHEWRIYYEFAFRCCDWCYKRNVFWSSSWFTSPLLSSLDAPTLPVSRSKGSSLPAMALPQLTRSRILHCLHFSRNHSCFYWHIPLLW